GDDRAPKPVLVEERGAAQELFGRMKEEGGLAGVAAHRAVIVALLAEAEEHCAARGDRRAVRNAFLEQPRRAAGGGEALGCVACGHGLRSVRPGPRRRSGVSISPLPQRCSGPCGPPDGGPGGARRERSSAGARPRRRSSSVATISCTCSETRETIRSTM